MGIRKEDVIAAHASRIADRLKETALGLWQAPHQLDSAALYVARSLFGAGYLSGSVNTPRAAEFAAIRELIEACREGTFYQDHDASCEMLGRAEEDLVRAEQT